MMTTQEMIEAELILFEKTCSMDEIFENLYIGNYAAACNKSILLDKGVTNIIVAANNFKEFFPEEFCYKTIPLYDSEYTNISKYFEESNNFIKESISKGKILVHCGAGISRSVSLVIAFMISNMNLTYAEAFYFIKEKRKISKPNCGFEKQLRNYSYEIHKKI